MVEFPYVTDTYRMSTFFTASSKTLTSRTGATEKRIKDGALTEYRIKPGASRRTDNCCGARRSTKEKDGVPLICIF